MTRDAVRIAVHGSLPFVTATEDGRQFAVREEFKVAAGEKFIVVLDERECPHRLSFPAISDIRQLPREDVAPWEL